MLIPVTQDLYSVDERLREIDGGYYIMYNTVKGGYEVHNSRQYGGSYCLTLPYRELDARAVSFVKSTRREYMDNVLNEMERNNSRLLGGI